MRPNCARPFNARPAYARPAYARLSNACGALALGLAFLGAGALPLMAETAAPAATEPKSTDIVLPAISVTPVVARRIEDHVLASGLITAVEQVMVPPLIEGQPIETLAVDVGDTVKAGQVLATLSTATLTLQQSQLKASLASAAASLAEAQRTADRTAALLAQGTASNAANDTAQATLTSAKAQVASVQAQLDTVALQISRAQVVAPVAGLITARNAQIGAVASAAGQPLFQIMRDGALELRIDVAEADLPRVKTGQSATVTLASGVEPLTGTISLVEPTIDVTSRLGRARITLDAPEKVRAGMYAEADILITAHDALVVPVTSVISDGKVSSVMMVTDGVVHAKDVTTGIRQAGWVEIVSGLAAGDQIVAKAGAFVSEGDKINPIASPTSSEMN
jgi:HlyD family secretion protein